MHYVKSILLVIGVIVVAFIIISLFDIVISVVSSKFYSTAAFIVIFGVGGVFAGFYSYGIAYSSSPVKNNTLRWIVLMTMIITAGTFFFLFARYEKEYHMAFKSFAVTVALTALLIKYMRPLFFLTLISLSGYAQQPKLVLPTGHAKAINTAVFSPDGRNIVTSSDDHTIKIWEIKTGDLLSEMIGHTKQVFTAVYSSDGTLIMRCFFAGRIAYGEYQI